MQRRATFFQGSELSRLLILLVIMVVGWGLFWRFAQDRPALEEPPVTVAGPPEPIVADRSEEFESVTDRTPMSFRDNAAYALLLERARTRSPQELAASTRRDVVLTHLWERPALYRGVPIHLFGTTERVIRYESKLSKNGWLYEAWIYPQESRTIAYCCVFDEVPAGFPIGTNLNERVVFNGYFLKIMKYHAGDVARGAPVLVGRIGWNPHDLTLRDGGGGMSPMLRWSLIILGAMFVLSLGRWIFQLRRFFAPPERFEPPSMASTHDDQLDPRAFDAWARSVGREDDRGPARDHGEGGLRAREASAWDEDPSDPASDDDAGQH
jgi:hypothetical protein